MNRIIIILTCVFIAYSFNVNRKNNFSNNFFSKSYLQNNGERNGIWIFQKLTDSSGNQIDTIFENGGYEIANGPEIILNQDFSYKKKFPFNKIDSGNWEYSESLNMMTFHLFIDPESYVGKYLIKKGVAVKYKDGKHYQKIKQKIIFKSNSEMEVYRDDKYIYIYRKKEKDTKD